MKKRCVALAAAFCLLVFLTPGAYAASGQSDGLEKAILAVKAVTEMPDSYSRFEYAKSQQEDQDGQVYGLWELYWHDEDYNNGISACVDENFCLLEYNHFSGERSQGGLAAVTKEQAKQNADDFLKRAVPAEADKMKCEQDAVSSYSNTFDFSYTLYEKDIPVAFQRAQVRVNKYTGEVTAFSRTGAEVQIRQYPDLTDTISLAQAKASYLEAIGLHLQYNIVKDYSKKTAEAVPVYVLSAGDQKAVDAKSGNIVEIYRDERFLANGEGATSDAAAQNRADKGLSQAELEELQKTENLLTQQEALSCVQDQAPGSGSWNSPDRASLSRDSFDQEKYIWNFYKEGRGSAGVNAATGELLSYYKEENQESGRQSVSEENAKSQTEAFLKSVSPEKFNKSAFKDFEQYDEGSYYSFTYTRQENGIDVSGNGFYVSYDKTKGEIVSFHQSWDEKLTFEDLEGAASESLAFDAAAQAAEFQMMYERVEKNTVIPVYHFRDAVTVYVDPFTLQRINGDGTAYKEASVTAYDDLEGKWYEAAVKALLENGYYLEGTSFEGEKTMTQEAFLRYLYAPDQKYYEDTEAFYNMLINEGIIQKEEIAPEEALLRQEAAKYIIRALGLEQAAKMPGIYLNPFNDTFDEAYKGYAALCCGLEIFAGDKNGNFNGQKALTRGEAAVVIYHYLSVR